MSSEAMESEEGAEEGAEEGKGPSQEAWRRGRMLQLLTGASTALIGTSYILYRQLHAEEGETSEEVGLVVARAMVTMRGEGLISSVGAHI